MGDGAAPCGTMPPSPAKILQQPRAINSGRLRKAQQVASDSVRSGVAQTVGRAHRVRESQVPETLREVGRARGPLEGARVRRRRVVAGPTLHSVCDCGACAESGCCLRARAPAQACTHDEGKATLISIDIPATRPREPPASLDEPPAQRTKRGDGDEGEPAREARCVPADGASDEGSVFCAAGAAGDRGTTRRAPARLIATRTVHIPKACWSAATDPGIEMEFWQVGAPCCTRVKGPLAHACTEACTLALLGAGDEGTTNSGGRSDSIASAKARPGRSGAPHQSEAST